MISKRILWEIQKEIKRRNRNARLENEEGKRERETQTHWMMRMKINGNLCLAGLCQTFYEWMDAKKKKHRIANVLFGIYFYRFFFLYPQQSIHFRVVRTSTYIFYILRWLVSFYRLCFGMIYKEIWIQPIWMSRFQYIMLDKHYRRTTHKCHIPVQYTLKK